MVDVNPNWSAFFSDFLAIILRMIYSIADVCSDAFFVLQTYTVREIIEEYLSDGLLGEILEFFLNLFVSSWFLDLLLWEFLLFGGIVVAVIINLVKIIH